jgi:phage gp45-like
MMEWEHDDAVRSILRRAVLTQDADDKETQQKVNLRGFKSDEPEEIHRFQLPGIHSVPKKGGEGVYLEMGGRSDRGLFLGGEHKDHKPKGKEAGDTFLYDHHGNILSLVKKEYRVVHSKEAHIVAGGIPVIIKNGNVYLGAEAGTARVYTEKGLSRNVYAKA